MRIRSKENIDRYNDIYGTRPSYDWQTDRVFTTILWSQEEQEEQHEQAIEQGQTMQGA